MTAAIRPARRFPLPRGLVARIALVLLIALAAEFIGNSLLHAWQDQQLVTREQTNRIAERLIVAERVAADLSPRRRGRLVADLAIDGMTLNWVPRTVITDFSGSHARLRAMKAQLAAQAPALGGRDLRLSLIPSDDGQRRDMIGAMAIADGTFITFRVHPFLNSPPPFAAIICLHLLLLGAVLGLALLMVRALVRPLRDLAAAADATGPGHPIAVKVEGPWEVRQVAAAFGAMQTRLLRMMEDHTQALVAVSHDLRTPIQRLQLRAGLLDDVEARDAMTADLIDIETFVGSIVGFMQGEAAEAERLVDLAAIAMTFVDNAADTGATIDYQGPDELALPLKPTALKRALGNLVENAVRHAGQVRVTLAAAETHAVLTVDDDGPGIPADRRDEMFLPFRRLGNVAGRGSGGAGLGLAIVRSAVASLGGTITLGESDMGGLSARIELPRH